MLVRLWALLSGLDSADKRALPIGEFLHPISLASLALLALNDHVFKGAGMLSALITGKLSDFAGLVFFPLLCTSLVDLLLLAIARVGPRIDFSLRRTKTLVAILFTAGFFSTIKLSARAADRVADWLSVAGWDATIVADPTDLLALIALIIPWSIGRAEIARVPLGRLEWIGLAKLETEAELQAALRDVGEHATVDSLVQTIIYYRATGDSTLLNDTLQFIRFGAKRASRDRIV